MRHLLICIGLVVAVSARADTPWTLAEVKAYAAAEVKIERLRKQKPADWNAIAKVVDATMPIVKAVSKDITGDIQRSLALCKRGSNTAVEQQTIAKGLQHVTVLAIGMCLDEAGRTDDVGAKEYIEEAAAFFEGIRPTFVRRDSDYFPAKKLLETTADRALGNLKKGGKASLFSARRSLNDVLNRTYALCVYYEISSIEKLRSTDRPQCAGKLREAEVFYQTIRRVIARRSPSANNAIIAMFKLNYDAMSAAEIGKQIARGLGRPFLPEGAAHGE